jgi:hypothetical protein
MCYRLYLIIILCCVSASGLAGEKRYRVEILLLSHLHHEAVSTDTESLRDFSAALDFLKIEDEEEAEVDEAEPDPPVADSELATGEPGEPPPEEEQAELPWADVIAVEEKGDVMREAWRRLRLSAPFRPEQYLSWEQSADEPFPTLRIHDQEIILIDDPYAELRDLEVIDAEGGGEPAVFGDQGSIMPPSDSEEASMEFEEEPVLPDPTLYYRVDGTVMLKRSRFLHLDLDLEIREAVYDDQEMPSAPILSGENSSVEQEPPLPTSFRIHKLQQSRQVKSQQMEYFDSPVLGVLAWITSFEAGEEEVTEQLSN